jgi:hypothetical protein
MLTGRYRRIFHYHLKKCGGSTLNRWLDTLTSDERAFNTVDRKGMTVFDTSSDGTQWSQRIIPSVAKSVFHWSDVVHSHGPLRVYAPDGTFCFTVLRDPVQRLLSQVSDLRRLSDADTADHPPEWRACFEDSRRLSLKDFLDKHAHRGGFWFLDNYMTRALAAGRVGNELDEVRDPDRLCEVALLSLETDYDFVGLTDDMDLSRNAICAMVGLPPARKIPTINVSRMGGHPASELYGLDDVLDRLTRVDRVIYDRAQQLFFSRHKVMAEAYDTAAFETQHAARLLGEARGLSYDGATRYSVRMPIVGSGFHGRDGSGLPSCAVWSGPATRTTLYIPTPSNMRLSLLVWIRGYVDGGQRGQLRVRVGGKPVTHNFELANGYADVLTVDTCTEKSFVRLEIDIDETLESGEPGTDLHDSRPRGFAFDSYGWRPI